MAWSTGEKIVAGIIALGGAYAAYKGIQAIRGRVPAGDGAKQGQVQVLALGGVNRAPIITLPPSQVINPSTGKVTLTSPGFREVDPGGSLDRETTGLIQTALNDTTRYVKTENWLKKSPKLDSSGRVMAAGSKPMDGFGVMLTSRRSGPAPTPAGGPSRAGATVKGADQYKTEPWVVAGIPVMPGDVEVQIKDHERGGHVASMLFTNWKRDGAYEVMNAWATDDDPGKDVLLGTPHWAAVRVHIPDESRLTGYRSKTFTAGLKRETSVAGVYKQQPFPADYSGKIYQWDLRSTASRLANTPPITHMLDIASQASGVDLRYATWLGMTNGGAGISFLNALNRKKTIRDKFGEYYSRLMERFGPLLKVWMSFVGPAAQQIAGQLFTQFASSGLCNGLRSIIAVVKKAAGKVVSFIRSTADRIFDAAVSVIEPIQSYINLGFSNLNNGIAQMAQGMTRLEPSLLGPFQIGLSNHLISPYALKMSPPQFIEKFRDLYPTISDRASSQLTAMSSEFMGYSRWRMDSAIDALNFRDLRPNGSGSPFTIEKVIVYKETGALVTGEAA